MASEGLEPPTLCSEDRCSNPLSYEARTNVLMDRKGVIVSLMT